MNFDMEILKTSIHSPCRYIEYGRESFDKVAPLWYELRDYIHNRSRYFKSRYIELTFQDRIDELLAKNKEREILLHVAYSSEDDPVGYCITTASPGGLGAIESIYVKTAYRRIGIGDRFMQRSLSWQQEVSTISNRLLVTVGNEEVLPFYERYGYLLRHIILEIGGDEIIDLSQQ